MMIKSWLLLVTALVGSGWITSVQAQTGTFGAGNKKLEISRVNPQGQDVPVSAKQIVISFNQPMVELGQFRNTESMPEVSIQPALNCDWHWIDTSSLACELSRDEHLLMATKYQVSLKPTQSQVTKKVMESDYHGWFSTARPKATRVSLHNWSKASRPEINIDFSQPVTWTSVSESLRLRSLDSTFTTLLKPVRQLNGHDQGAFYQLNETSDFSWRPPVRKDGTNSQLDELAHRESAHREARSRWVLSPSDSLPDDEALVIEVQAGLRTIEGDLPGLEVPDFHRFQSLPDIDFIGVRCVDEFSDKAITLTPTQAAGELLRNAADDAKKTQACDPQSTVRLIFTAPVSYQSAARSINLSNLHKREVLELADWQKRSDRYAIRSFYRSRFAWGSKSDYEMVLPTTLNADAQYNLYIGSDTLDEAGRSMPASIDMAFLTGHRKPKLLVNHNHSVLEANVDSELPIYVTNLDSLKLSSYSLTKAYSRETSHQYIKSLPNIQDVSYSVPLGIREVLSNESGMVVGRVDSLPSVTTRWTNNQVVSQVTPFLVHLKFGHFNSAAWVTRMDTGKPVEGAEVTLVVDSYSDLEPIQDDDPVVLTDADGLASLPGSLKLDPSLKWSRNYRFNDPRLILKIRKGNQVGFLPLDYHYSTWAQEWPKLRSKDGYLHAWGTTAQGVYKAGDTIQFKIYVRGRTNQSWTQPPQGNYQLRVNDPQGQTVYEKNVSLNAFGSFADKIDTTTNSVSGWYQFTLNHKRAEGLSQHYPMKVLVSDFTPTEFKVETGINADLLTPSNTLEVDTNASFHSGGPYANSEVRVSVSLHNTPFVPTRPEHKTYSFGGYARAYPQTLFQTQSRLNEMGQAVSEFDLSKVRSSYATLTVESAVRDDRGKYVAATATAKFAGQDRFIGLKQPDWVLTVGKKAKLDVMVLDPDGKPIKHKVDVKIERRITTSSRVKSAGNAYLTQYSHEWVLEHECELQVQVSSSRCRFTPSAAGVYRMTASAEDSAGKPISNSLNAWAVGSGAVVWEESRLNRLDIVADKNSYKRGDVAKFLVKNPYPGAEALISIERYGILRSWRQKLEGNTPIIEVPIEQDDYPGFYLSAVVVSPRVAKPLGPNKVDLGKPAMKMGYTKVKVDDDSKDLIVKIDSQKEVYRPNEQVNLAISASPVLGQLEQMEVAVVAIDESVFQLNRQGEAYYDPSAGFNRLESLGVTNFNLLMRLVGRQKFEKKGANPGGGGFSDADTRSVDGYVAYWDPNIGLDQQGRARRSFVLPENLTGWRIFALAVDREDRMGLGQHTIKVNQPTEIRPSMPNFLTQGDKSKINFSVLNRSDKRRKLKIELQASGSALNKPILKRQELELDPFERTLVGFDVQPDSIGMLEISAKAGDGFDVDALSHAISVNTKYRVITQASYGSAVDSVQQKILFPKDSIDSQNAISVALSPSVISNILGAFEYQKNYPYACWEQRLSKALSAQLYLQLKSYLPESFEWSGAKDLAAEVLTQASKFQATNGGMTYWVNRDRYVSPYLSAFTALAFNWMREQGHDIPTNVEQKLHDYLLKYLRDSNDGPEKFTIRAIAIAALVSNGRVGLDEVNRLVPHAHRMSSFGISQLLQAQLAAGDDTDRIAATLNRLMSRGTQSGGKFSIDEKAGRNWLAIHGSSIRSNCAALSSILTTQRLYPSLAVSIDDLPFKQVRAISQARGSRFHWENTQENLFCMDALARFSKVYEAEPVNLKLFASIGTPSEERTQETAVQKKLGSIKFSSVNEGTVILPTTPFPSPTKEASVQIEKAGQGRFYYSLRAQYALEEESLSRLNSGLDVTREYSIKRDGKWVLLESPVQVEAGELIRVDLFVSNATARHFVVVDDPVFAGAEPLNADLATTSNIDLQNDSRSFSAGSVGLGRKHWTGFGAYDGGFYHKELKHDAARFYSDYLPAGNHHLRYFKQVIATGNFFARQTKAEEMYDPDVFGTSTPARLHVQQTQ